MLAASSGRRLVSEEQKKSHNDDAGIPSSQQQQSLTVTRLYLTSKLYDVQSPVATLTTITEGGKAGNADKRSMEMLLDVAFIFILPFNYHFLNINKFNFSKFIIFIIKTPC